MTTEILERPLTPRQEEVNGLRTSGLTHKQIARILGISKRTVESHVRDIDFRNDIHFLDPIRCPSFQLFGRQEQIWECLSEGMSPKQISQELSISVRSVWAGMGFIKKRLRLELAPHNLTYYAVQHKLAKLRSIGS